MAKIPLLALLPPVIFASLAGLFYFGMMRDDPNALPSTMIGRTAPALTLTPLGDSEMPTVEGLQSGGVKLVNFWASWCGPCRAEHPNLEEMAANGIQIVGINYKDQPDNALGFLAELGNPFTEIGADGTGRTGIEWGVYGVPETFVLDGKGQILYRHPGPITARVMNEKILPAIAAAE